MTSNQALLIEHPAPATRHAAALATVPGILRFLAIVCTLGIPGILASLFTLALLGPAAAAQAAEPPVAGGTGGSLAARLDRAIAPYVAAADFHGVIAIGRDGEKPLLRAYGPASVELGVAHRPDGVFMIGSVSKQMTAAAILLLEEDGILTTGDRVSEHLPGFAHGNAITIEQLLTHTAGIADVYSLERFGRTQGRAGTLSEVIADLGARPLTHPPGSVFAYSNGGYSVLAAIIQSASGSSYGDFLERRIFAPLAMTDTAHDSPGPAARGRVPGYDPWGAYGLTPVAPVAPGFTVGSGSIWSSAAGLLRWSAALHGGELLAPESYAKLLNDNEPGYGFGVSVFRRFDRDVVGHDGRVAGFSSDLARYLDDRLTVVVLSNVQSVARDEIRRLAAAAALGVEIEAPARPVLAAAAATDLSELAGTYSFGPTLDVFVRVEDGRLLARANQGGSSELVALSGGGWFSRLLYTGVRFGRDDEGRVDRLLWGLGDGAPAGARVGPQ